MLYLSDIYKQLFGCSVPHGEDGKVKCINRFRALSAASFIPPPILISPSTCPQYNGRKRGRKKGSGAPLELSISDWYNACHTFENLDKRMKQSDFLKSSLTHKKIVGTISQRQSFSQILKKFRSGTLKPLPGKRERTKKFVQVEERLINYINLRTEEYKRDKCGLSWMLLKEKTLKWGKELGLEASQASNGWITDTLRRYGITRVTLHGEANDLTDEDVEKVITPWRKELKDLIEGKV